MAGSDDFSAAGRPPDLVLFEGHHRGLQKHLIRLLRATRDPMPKPTEARAFWRVEIVSSLAALRNFAEFHFADEEKLMGDVGFPGLADHAREHQAYLTWMSDLDDLLEQDARRLHTESVGESLVAWWDGHAAHYDTMLADFLCRGGV